MASLTHSNPRPIPVSVTHACPADCALPEAILCWLRHERELRADLAGALGSPDADVLRADLAAAERQIDAMLGHGVALTKMRRIVEGIWP